MKREKIIIDTDIGDDIDDALAIAFALQSPELELVGVTTVFGNTQARARIAAHLLTIAGHTDVGVFAGCGQPLKGRIDESAVPCQYIGEQMDRLPVSSLHGVDFIIDRIMTGDEGEDITLVAIGPLTNVAAALEKEPELKNKLKRIVLMGGAFYFHFLEWNIKCDPEAADLVFRSGVPIQAVGLDVTKGCLMTDEQLDRLERSAADTPLIGLIWELIRQWQDRTGRKRPILHDALAIHALCENSCLRFEREAIDIELSGTFTRGMTFNRTDRDREEQLVAAAAQAAEPSRTEVARAVDSRRFMNLFIERLLGNGQAKLRS